MLNETKVGFIPGDMRQFVMTKELEYEYFTIDGFCEIVRRCLFDGNSAAIYK